MTIWRAFLTGFGVVGVMIGFVSWFAGQDDTVGVPTLVILLGIAVIAIIALLELLMYEKQKEKARFSRVRNTRLETESGILRLILDKSPLFTFGIYVSIFEKERGLEIPIGWGVVENVMENGRIVVLVRHAVPGTSEHWKKVASNDVGSLKNLLVKPSLLSAFFEQGATEETDAGI